MPYVLQQLLSQSARLHPDKPAISARGKGLTYRELEERSNQLACFLRQRGIRKGDRIGLYSSKRAELVAAMFGVVKAGAVYVPLDPQAPAERIRYIIGNCGIRGLITAAERLRTLDASTVPSVEFAVLADNQKQHPSHLNWEELSQFDGAHAPELDATTTDLAYILYTSGSTGRPKGVMLSHQNALTFIEWCAEEFHVTSDDVLSNHAPLHFDLSVFDVYNGIKAGATIYMVPEEIAMFPANLGKFMETNKISVWYSVPSALILLLEHANLTPERIPELRTVLFAGEVFPMKYLRRLADLLPKIDLYNLYGPTETNVCTYYKVNRGRLNSQEKLPIGRACGNTEVFAVDEHDRLIGPGEVGELYVRGPAVTPGYWADPEKTAKMCVPNRFQKNFEEKMYRTGDLVTPDEEGGYLFLGRRDSQIKSRGYRIELGEIEAALLSHGSVKEAAAVAIPDEAIGNRIKAFVSLTERDGITALELQQHCAARIPKYMIPEFIELYDVLPKTSTGKIDRVSLANKAPAA
ncbi:MAG TPA: amino acid adenylation domain-containing protein [Terriglobales bacterium]|nr:amino acid adenylation domain-containing protein [Terriglobales bacterium]